MKAKHVAESTIFDLLNAERSDCPICTAITESTRSWLESTLSNLMHNFEARDKLLKGGMCEKHRNITIELARSDSSIGGLSVALLFEEMLSRQVKALGIKKRKTKRNEKSCYLCSFEEETAGRYLNSLASLFNALRWRLLYENSKQTICIEHSDELLSLIKGDTERWFREVQNKKFLRLHQSLKLYINKHDYRNSEPFGPETDSWKLTAKLVGEKKT
ncbi:DUF6062 family protein [Kosmotoga pacifica]|uniref:Uncharacterized protein n=1 Tax=Kosmotoga pacifica TaxID=1330330 RepID=A0A0G2Z8A4_9BACT|nr:DUF6062 family protein [Kosmotoga pacifica]AKI97845.1 hypothetical protein IX53_08515 [Kosmotoga pacifica]